MLVTVMKLIEYIFSFFKKNQPHILYHGKHYIIVNKPYDIMINSNDTAEYTIQQYLKKAVPHLANYQLCHNFYFVHRLDYATSGLMCIPLTKVACQRAACAFSDREVKKYYLAVLRGFMSSPAMAVRRPIGTHRLYPHKMCTDMDPDCVHPRNAITVILALETGLYDNAPCTKVLIRALTGRRHQIRVHCSYLGHTILGDYTYSDRKDSDVFRMFLHAQRLVIPNVLEWIDQRSEDPFTNQRLRNWKTIKRIRNIDDVSYGILDFISEQI